MADHNDPNAVNSIFSDIDYSAADLYDLFGFPTHDGRNALLALTFSSTPKAGELDGDLLYRLLVTSEPRVALAARGRCQPGVGPRLLRRGQGQISGELQAL